jgi:hypothetical protein
MCFVAGKDFVHNTDMPSQGPDAGVLPGCSASKINHDHEPTRFVVSNSMMQAYVEMRGPLMGGDNDPLFEWIRHREEHRPHDLHHQHPVDGRKDIRRMLSKIDRVLDSANPNVGESPRDAIFEIMRPPLQHIRPPPGMDVSLHALGACCAEFEFEDVDSGSGNGREEEDEDDDERGASSGRISPCTFLAWSVGCKRWDDTRSKEHASKVSQSVCGCHLFILKNR